MSGHLNKLLADRAEQFNGRNGVSVGFNWNVYDRSSTIAPFHISRLDCYHPSRAGQMWLAMLIRQGWEPAYAPTARIFHDGLDSKDYCLQEFTTWPGCWLDPQDGDPLSGDVQITDGKLMVRDNNTLVSRPFDLSALPLGTDMWLRFQSSRNLGGSEKVLFDNIKIFSW
jgi:hypothetical protein